MLELENGALHLLLHDVEPGPLRVVEVDSERLVGPGLWHGCLDPGPLCGPLCGLGLPPAVADDLPEGLADFEGVPVLVGQLLGDEVLEGGLAHELDALGGAGRLLEAEHDGLEELAVLLGDEGDAHGVEEVAHGLHVLVALVAGEVLEDLLHALGGGEALDVEPADELDGPHDLLLDLLGLADAVLDLVLGHARGAEDPLPGELGALEADGDEPGEKGRALHPALPALLGAHEAVLEPGDDVHVHAREHLLVHVLEVEDLRHLLDLRNGVHLDVQDVLDHLRDVGPSDPVEDAPELVERGVVHLEGALLEHALRQVQLHLLRLRLLEVLLAVPHVVLLQARALELGPQPLERSLAPLRDQLPLQLVNSDLALSLD